MFPFHMIRFLLKFYHLITNLILEVECFRIRLCSEGYTSLIVVCVFVWVDEHKTFKKFIHYFP